MADAYIEKGTTYEIDGKVYECLEFLHVKPGKGSAFVRTKLKDVINGGVVERTFNPSKDVLKKACCSSLWIRCPLIFFPNLLLHYICHSYSCPSC